jgi:FixJ family two-component response regulator
MAVEPTVFLVDDDPSARKSFRFLAESVGLRVACYCSALGFLAEHDPAKPGCLVLDVRMPHMSGLDLQQKLTEANVRLPIIFVSGHADVAIAARAFRAGAFDFVEKPVDDRLLLERIQQALAKDAAWRREDARLEEIRVKIRTLTPREREVMDRLVEGKTIKQIAAQFTISVQTAAKHRTRVLDKMRVANDVELAGLVNSLREGEASP